MIEQGHLAAMKAAAKDAGEFAERNDLQGITTAVKQIEAVRQINELSKRILAKLGVADISIHGTTDELSEPHFIPKGFMSTGETFGKQFRDYRHSTRLSGEQFRLITGLTPVSVCRYETGKILPGVKVLLRTVHTLGMSRQQAEGFVQSAGFPPSLLDAPNPTTRS
jgi:hypothetical protein